MNRRFVGVIAALAVVGIGAGWYLLGFRAENSATETSGAIPPLDPSRASPSITENPEMSSDSAPSEQIPDVTRVTRTDAEWRELLTPLQYEITREKGTERAFTGELWDNKRDGTYKCVCCGQPLFHSKAKFESGTGWPSFYEPLDSIAVRTKDDNSWFARRTEVLCSQCDAHLGHVFPDGPRPTGMRYCMNSAALTFEPAPERPK